MSESSYPYIRNGFNFLSFFAHFSYFVEIDVDTTICRNFRLSKKDFSFAFYQCFKILNFAKKKQKKDEKTIEKDTEITIDNVIFKFFNKKKVILSKKSIFRLIMTSNIFHLKIIFYIGKMVSQKFWRSKKSFLSNNRA